ncbi:MAG: glutamate--tRNA ligase [Patescibacteria group bacterium]
MIESHKKTVQQAHNKPVRTRFAPSPTGPMHLGGARTALFNWLFARQHNGKFILRIEDTDIERSKPEYERDIIEGLKWLNFDFDEGPDKGGEFGPYRQSERLDIYETYLKKLLDENKAYYCFCTKEELEGDRQAMMSQGLAPKYGGRCRNLSKDEIEKRLNEGKNAVIRFKILEHEIEVHDLIRGKIKFDAGLIGDIIIAKNIKSPLFNFAGAVDDYEMKITHVIRGEDHLSNTPKQILIGQALGFEEIKYAHLPLILAPDRSKLSKRYLDTSLNDYRCKGYLSQTMVNFIALLGWHPKDEKEILSLEELLQEFEIKRVQKAGAVFNIEKLDWLNASYIRGMEAVDLVKELENFIPDEWHKNKKLLIKAVAIEKERMKKLTDFKEGADFFFELSDYEPKLLIWKDMTPSAVTDNLRLVMIELEKIPEIDFNRENLEAALMFLAEAVGKGELFWPLRVGVSGKQFSPPPFEIMEAIGKEETLKRIDRAIKNLS